MPCAALAAPRRAHHREDPLNIEIRTQPLAGPALVRDYLSGEGTARSFYRGSPFSPASFASKWDEVQRRFGPAEREVAARALRPTSDRARERLERFVREGGAVITTGQQAGFLTGPLFTIYKALTVARLAESLEAEIGSVVLPVFWTASEDHDWAEVNHAFLLDREGEVRRLEIPSEESLALPMSERSLGEEVKRILDEVAEALSGHPFENDLLSLVRGAYVPGRTVAESFSAMVAGLFASFDVCLVDAADPHLKRASVPVLRQALVDAGRLGEVVARRSGRLLEEGYHAQVAVLEGATNVFYQGTGQRERVDRGPEGFALHESHVAFESTALLEELEARPGLFSPNVLLRPIVESAVLPTLAYVAGPGEISYFAQIDALFPEFGIETPVVYPRFSATLVEPAIRRVMGRLRLDPADLSQPPHELATRLARDAMPTEVRSGLQELARSLTDGYRRLIEEAVRIDPTLRGALGALRNESLEKLDQSERKIVQRVKEREATTLAQLDRVRAHLRPGGQPQERVLNAVPFLARYGPELMRRIHAEVDVAWEEAALPEARPVPDDSA